MAPEPIRPAKAKNAAVMIPLIKREGEWYILFEKRSEKIVQGGEICFPGGVVEENEEVEDAVVREVAEELLVSPNQVRVIAPMHCMNRVGGGTVTSYLGEITDYVGTFSEDEVSDIYEISLSYLLAYAVKIYESEMVPNLPENFPYDKIPGGKKYPFRKEQRRFYFYEIPENTPDARLDCTSPKASAVMKSCSSQTDSIVIWGLTAELLYHFLETLREVEALHSDR